MVSSVSVNKGNPTSPIILMRPSLTSSGALLISATKGEINASSVAFLTSSIKLLVIFILLGSSKSNRLPNTEVSR